MTTQPQRRAFPFDARSVALFAALTFGTAGALQARASQASGAQFGPAAASSSSHSGAKAGAAPAPKAGGANTAPGSAFEDADANHDGKISAQEAARSAVIGPRFKQLDKDGDGVLSRQEFDQGDKS